MLKPVEICSFYAYKVSMESLGRWNRMPRCSDKLEELRLKAGLSRARLARMADLDRNTVRAAEIGQDVQKLTVTKMLNALSKELGETLQIGSVIKSG